MYQRSVGPITLILWKLRERPFRWCVKTILGLFLTRYTRKLWPVPNSFKLSEINIIGPTELKLWPFKDALPSRQYELAAESAPQRLHTSGVRRIRGWTRDGWRGRSPLTTPTIPATIRTHPARIWGLLKVTFCIIIMYFYFVSRSFTW